jgi:hypothetical protein
LKPPLRKSQDIFSAISFQPYSATCWKQFQSVPLLEVYEMTALDFDVNGFFKTYVKFSKETWTLIFLKPPLRKSQDIFSETNFNENGNRFKGT